MKRPATEMSPGLSSDYPPTAMTATTTTAMVNGHHRRRRQPLPETTDVLIVGAGPAGLMLATQLARFNIPCKIIDDRDSATTTGRADGLQPKTLETFKQMRIAEPLLRKGVKIYDISFWNSTEDAPRLQRRGREVHYPPVVDVLEPYILLVHQGMIEDLFIEDMKARGVQVQRRAIFETLAFDDGSAESSVARVKAEKEKVKDVEGKEEVKEVVVKEADGDSVMKDSTELAPSNSVLRNGETKEEVDAASAPAHAEEEYDEELKLLKAKFPVEAAYMDHEAGAARTVRAKYVVGCDGAHSAVRRALPGVAMEGESSDVFWGVLDGEVETDFPDLWSKCAISNHAEGTILCIPRERNMTRLYIELSHSKPVSKAHATPEFVQARAAAIMSPYRVKWTSIEWFGVYQIGQRVASSFSSYHERVFIAGDAAHTHSPKAAQGMNVSMHDTYNLSWKLWLVVRGLASARALLPTYAEERRKIAKDLIAFDHEHAEAFRRNDAAALAQNFKTNIRFISGVGATYAPGTASNPALRALPPAGAGSRLRPGHLLPPSRAVRFVDANPIDVQLDIPVLGQFRVYFLAPDYLAARPFLDGVTAALADPELSLLARVSRNSKAVPPLKLAEMDLYIQPARYATTGRVWTPALLTLTPRANIELEELPWVLREARWTVYTDAEPLQGKWVDSADAIEAGETQIVVVRPDGYVGAISDRWGESEVEEAVAWVDDYFSGFLVA